MSVAETLFQECVYFNGDCLYITCCSSTRLPVLATILSSDVNYMLVAFRRSLTLNRLPGVRKRPYSSSSVAPKHLLHKFKPILRDISGFIRDPANHSRVISHITYALNRHLPAVPDVAGFYQLIISDLLWQRFHKEAIFTYHRMLNEGVVPTSKTKAQMMALAFSGSGPEAKANEGLDTFLIHEGHSDHYISQTLEYALHFGASVDIVLRILKYLVTRRDGFTPTQDLISQVVSAQARAGMSSAAFATVLRYGEAETTAPYVAMINGLRKAKILDTETLELVLGFMREQNVQPDLAVMNGLLSWELRRHSKQKLWKTYHLLKIEAERGAITPDATTFAILFSSLLQQGPSKFEISPRSLYHDMAFFHQRVPMKMNANMLNIALRVFMERTDYAAALVVLRCFGVWEVPVSARTYAVVLKHIMRRIRTAKADKLGLKYRWSSAFLGHSGPSLRILKTDETLMLRILSFSRASDFTIGEGVFARLPREVITPVPSSQQLRRDPVHHQFPSLPLHRLLLCALVAGAPTKEYRAYTSRKVKEAQRVMNVALGKWMADEPFQNEPSSDKTYIEALQCSNT